jgi:hypothetical protein
VANSNDQEITDREIAEAARRHAAAHGDFPYDQPKALKTAKALRKRQFKPMSREVDRVTSGDKLAVKRMAKYGDSIYETKERLQARPDTYNPNRD